MTGSSHLLLGTAVGITAAMSCCENIISVPGLCVVGGCVVGSLFPDIDSGTSKISCRMPVLSFFIRILFGHRNLLHGEPVVDPNVSDPNGEPVVDPNVSDPNGEPEGGAGGDLPTTPDGMTLTEDVLPVGEEVSSQYERLENARLNNLEQVDKANEYIQLQDEKISQYRDAIASQEKEGASTKEARDSLDKTIGARNEEMSQLNREIKNGEELLHRGKKGTPEYNALKENLNEKRVKWEELNEANKDDKKALESLNKKYSPYENRITSLKKEITLAEERKTAAIGIRKEHENKEKEFANLEKLYGGSGEEFSTRGQYAEAVRNREIEKHSMTYRNFDSKANISMLSPQETADFYRQRAKANLAKSAGANVAGVIVGGLGAASMVYGGPQATVIGAAGGTMLGKGVASKTISLAEDSEDHNRSINSKQTVDKYFEKNPAKRGDKIFTSGGSKKATWSRNADKSKQEDVSPKTPDNEKTVVQSGSERVKATHLKYSGENDGKTGAEEMSGRVKKD